LFDKNGMSGAQGFSAYVGFINTTDSWPQQSLVQGGVLAMVNMAMRGNKPSPTGFGRSILTYLFGGGTMPAFVFATKASHYSNRPVETVSALLAAFNQPLDDNHSDGDYAQVASDILTKSKYAGQVVLVCWHHGEIPALAQALGIVQPPPWPGSVFDRVWQLVFSGGTASLSHLPQQLLYGDSPT
jgi:hypothetical protein